jgi:phosphatidylserine decarboxylase
LCDKRILDVSMSQTLEEFLTSIESFKKLPVDVISSLFFFRDPARPQFTDEDFIWSPADGVIIGQEFAKPTEEIAEIKGTNYTTQKILENPEFDKEALVISIFMTFYDVHVNRMPTSGSIFFRHLEPLQTLNMPMLFEEKNLMGGHAVYEDIGGYITKNSRCVNTIRCSRFNYTYYLVQIADCDVSVICPFTQKQGYCYAQNSRFSIVRYGSQVTLILPLCDDFDFDLCEKPRTHVRGGLDRLVYLRRSDRQEDNKVDDFGSLDETTTEPKSGLEKETKV